MGRLILFPANVISRCTRLQCESSVKQSAVVLSFAVIESLFTWESSQKKRYSAHMRRPQSFFVFFYFSLADGMIKNVQRQCFFSSAPISGTHDGRCAVVKRLDSGSNAA